MSEAGWTDAEMVLRSRGGDAEATDMLLTKFKPLVLKLSRARFLAGGEKDDLIQEGMIGLYKAIRDYDPGREARFSTFAALCINRQMIHAIEASQREKNLPLNNSISLTDEEWEREMKLSGESPESIVIGQEVTDERLVRLRKNLSPMERKVLAYYLEGLSYREIAEKMGKESKAIDNAIQRIRRKTTEM